MKRDVRIADWKPTPEQVKLVSEVVKSGRLTYGNMHRKFEKKFARLHGKKYAIFMNSGTSALQCALHYYKETLGWKDGDEIIIPAVTFVATVNVVLHERLKPVLVDIDPLDYNIDPELIEDALTANTRAIMPVSLLGYPCQIDKIMKIARRFNLKVIEDDCETMFVKYKGKPVGQQADIAVYSSYLAHLISTGVGGILATNDEKAEKYIRSLIWHGRDNRYLNIDDIKKLKVEERAHITFRFDKVGYSYRLTEMEAALGLGELSRYKEIIKKRQWNARYLTKHLSKFLIELPIIRKGAEHAFMFYPIIVWSYRDKLAAFLESKGIQTRLIMPLTNQPVYEKLFKEIDYPNAKFVNNSGLLLPCHQFLKKEDLDWIVKAFEDYFL